MIFFLPKNTSIDELIAKFEAYPELRSDGCLTIEFEQLAFGLSELQVGEVVLNGTVLIVGSHPALHRHCIAMLKCWRFAIQRKNASIRGSSGLPRPGSIR